MNTQKEEEMINEKISQINQRITESQNLRKGNLLNLDKLGTGLKGLFDKVTNLTSELIKSSDKSSDQVYSLLEKNQEKISNIIELEIKKENPSNEQIKLYINELKEIKEAAERTDVRKNKQNTNYLLIVSGLVLGVLTTLLNTRNNQEQ